MAIRVGIGGWVFAPWRGIFYPKKLPQSQELQHASRRLTSIEINGTFYGSQKPDSFRRWHDETPDDFVFSLKAPRFATNRRVLAEAGSSIDRFFASGVMLLQRKLGPINWQFAATKKFDPDDFSKFVELLPKSVDGVPLRHALEVRHESFCTPEFVALAREHAVAIVIAGDSKFPVIADATAPFVYVRIMGTQKKPELGYPDAALDAWAARAKSWAAGRAPDDLPQIARSSDKTPDQTPRDVFLYVIAGEKQRNPAAAMALIERLRR